MGLDLVEMVLELEAEFDVTLPQSELEKATTVGGLFRVIVDALPPATRPADAPTFSGTLWERYLTVVAQQLGVPRRALRPDSRFVADLGAN
jgi:acyl carrier protein